MAYKAIDIANWFINKFDKDVGDVVTHLKVQKLLYYSEAWSQLLLDRKLFEEEMEAWAHGPVVREVFNEFKEYGWEPLTLSKELVNFDEDTESVLIQVLESYGEASAKTLERMTHADEPWIIARGNSSPEARCNTVIKKGSIKNYFGSKYGNKIDD